MDLGERLRRWAGWVCISLVAAFVLMGYHFGNIRFAPLAGGFLILAAVCLIERDQEQVGNNAIHPGADSGVGRASG
ncbi:MAG TPA: hypothetical protein VGJ36_10030 [Gemmatimonadales bacterium]